MSKCLVIVESPTKVKTISKFLGRNYIIKSSVGHIRDLAPIQDKNLPKINKSTPSNDRLKIEEQKIINSMGIDPHANWKANYKIIANKNKVIKDLKDLCKKADKIILATDLDREGEAIAWHLKEILKLKNGQFSRIVFSEITKSAVLEAINNARDIDYDKVNAQQARRFLDRVVGFNISPVLWQKITRGLSAGRVQSVALNLICKRENIIRQFKPEEYWNILVDLAINDSNKQFKSEVLKHKGKILKIKNEKQTNSIIKELKASSPTLENREDKKTNSTASPPFITSTLQQAASSRLGFGVKKTMFVSQKLYEQGLITYMRTDSTQLSKEACKMAKEFIEHNFGKEYYPNKPNIYNNKNKTQEAHEAIRPTSLTFSHINLNSSNEQKLYQLIRNRFLASQMTGAKYLVSTLNIKAGDYTLITKGRQLLFDGFTKVWQLDLKDSLLPEISKSDKLKFQKFISKQYFTKPPARYTEASLVKELENSGIGRPSTYASVISTIQERNYAIIKQRKIHPEKIGEIVNNLLEKQFDYLINTNFTSNMENHLDDISIGKSNWKKVLNKFYQDIRLSVIKARNDSTDFKLSVITNIKCSKCKRIMLIRNGSYGIFLGCIGYNDKKNPCNNTVNLILDDSLINNDDGMILAKQKRCKKCNSIVESYYLADGNGKLNICSTNPKCDEYQLEKGDFSKNLPNSKQNNITNYKCHKCGSKLEFKIGRFGKYFQCTNENCKATRKSLADDRPAPPVIDPIPLEHLKCDKVNDYFVLREGQAGLFLAASKFPKNKEVRAPLISELQSIKDKLNDKFKFIIKAPTHDDSGNTTKIAFSKKTGEYYITSLKNGKATKFRLYYKDNKWVKLED